MKIISVVLYVAAVGFCVLGFIGHSAAWAAAALSFFTATMMIVGQQKDKRAKTEIKDHMEEEKS